MSDPNNDFFLLRREAIESPEDFKLGLKVACSTCGAKPLQTCVWKGNIPGTLEGNGCHAERLTAARRIAHSKPDKGSN